MVNKTHVKPHFGNRNMLTGQGAPGIFIVPEQARQKAAKLKATNTATKKGCDDALRLFEQLFELFSVGLLFSSKLFELIRVVVIFVVVIRMGPRCLAAAQGGSSSA